MSEWIECEANTRDEINVETDTYQTNGPYWEACDICLKPFEREPKIRCAECLATTLICMQCFALGLETQTHRCDHNYHIDRRHIPVDEETDWSLQEDYDLLQRVLEYGYGNYVALNKGFPHRTVDEIRIRIDELLSLDKAPLRACLQVGPRPVVPYNAEIIKHEPPRFPYRSAGNKQLAGYSAPRGDFETEFKNNAEEMLKNLDVDSDSDDDDDEGLGEELACALVECYNEKLRDRAVRKKVVKNYGLLSRRSHMVVANLHNPGMPVFMQLLDYQDYDSLVEGMSLELLLQAKMRRLKKYRQLGITRLRSGETYDKLETLRATEDRNLQKTVQAITNPGCLVKSSRKIAKAPPIDISQFPGFESLSTRERELCSNVRLLPEKFIESKKALIEFNRVEGGIRLMAARTLLKIDVNKTRKIFNFLIEEGVIKKI